MSADNYLEYFVVFLGWLMNNAIWDIILTTGLFALPLSIRLVGVWLKVREEGADEGNKGALALPRMEHVIYVAFVVILFCVMPVQSVDIQSIQFNKERSRQCSVNIPVSPDKTGYAALINDFNGQTAKIPLWWYLVHTLSKGVTRAAVASIPCGEELRQLRFDVQHTRIKDPVLLDEVQEFANQCYSKAYFRLKSTNSKLGDSTINAVGWIGSDYFLNTPGYYDYYTSTSPRATWPYSESRDSGYPDVGRGGYPSCKEWWNTPTKGLKARLLESYDATTIKALKVALGSGWEETSLRWLVSPKNSTLSGNGESYTTGNSASGGMFSWVTQGLANTGVAMTQVVALPGFDAMKTALPIVQALLLMVIVIIIPILLLFSAFDPKTVVAISFAIFALIFVSFWWELAGWLDDRLVRILYTSMDAKDGGSNVPFANFFSSTMDGWIMNLILGAMYLVFPVFWMGSLSWAGVKAGAAFSGVMEKASSGSQDAGKKGGAMVEKTVTSAITRNRGTGSKK
ncbi:conjugal transfer protein TraG N-terminal domain-containing protein [Salmonella enterica]|uniref:conjugal transfer protein TraG N-terminal domain-containing protein n=1 Tax=Salmonella enterica TaxID=28901 RepID=UPI0012C6CC1B|nr:conjugal transfer protein TraG N-terminal domain-containing protein [Salmonella enterica]EBF8098481.1 conjugal transfer protein TraG [Salmonella enterica subsp. enterica serovar Nigeria]EBZ0016626.1 conjugal transfer protein TraG [Salmonella enterica subsp. enterica serovar Suberu]EHZ3052454.1 conjugal transfer protein TraG N-terminal domain-containing protein [Salmonella enterica subsp. enterica]